jgi:predicted transcriptional regulator
MELHATVEFWPSAKWYHSGIMPGMGMTLRTSEKQTEALRRQALAEGRSMQAVALSAIDEYIERRAHQTEVNAVLDKVIERERGVLRRLADT